MIHKKALLIIATVISLMACTSQKNNFLVAGSGWNQIAKTTKEGKIIWTHNLKEGEECNHASVMKNGNIIYSSKKYANIVTPEHKIVWQHKAQEGTEIQSASETKEGNILIAQCGTPTKLFEFSADGELINQISFQTGISHPHSQTRQVTKTNYGTYLVPLFARHSVMEVNVHGEIIREVKVGGNAFCVKVLKNKNWLVAVGDSHRLVEVNPKNSEIVWEVKQNDIPGIKLYFVADLWVKKNGNIIICNWKGHNMKEENAPKLLEISRDKKLVWKLDEKDQFGLISSVDICN